LIGSNPFRVCDCCRLRLRLVNYFLAGIRGKRDITWVVKIDVSGKSGGAKCQQQEKVRSSKHAAFLDREEDLEEVLVLEFRTGSLLTRRSPRCQYK
jgi:hypothetical protein